MNLRNRNIATTYKKNYRHSYKQTIHDADYTYRFIKSYLCRYGHRASILDAGCGNGRYSKKLYSDGFTNIQAMDLFEQDMDPIPYKVCSIENLPYSNNYFDFVYSISVIHYIEDQANLFRELRRILNQDGMLIFSIFVSSSLASLTRRFKRRIGWNNKYHIDKLHFNSVQQYLELLESTGFKTLDINGYITPLYSQTLNFMEFKGFNMKFAPYLPISENKWISEIKAKSGYHALFAAEAINS